jgi:hypothetical protein
MHRTGRSANILRRPSNGRNSAGLKVRELQSGHSRRLQSNRGAQFNHFLFTLAIQFAPRMFASAQVSERLLLPVSSLSPAM